LDERPYFDDNRVSKPAFHSRFASCPTASCPAKPPRSRRA
jgi:hypothetical protein